MMTLPGGASTLLQRVADTRLLQDAGQVVHVVQEPAVAPRRVGAAVVRWHRQPTILYVSRNSWMRVSSWVDLALSRARCGRHDLVVVLQQLSMASSVLAMAGICFSGIGGAVPAAPPRRAPPEWRRTWAPSSSGS